MQAVKRKKATPRTPTEPSSFTSVLERAKNNLGWVILRIPASVSVSLGSRGQIRVKGKISRARNRSPEHEFRTTLFPDGHGGHYLLVNKAMQRGGGVKLGGVAEVRLEVDREKRDLQPPSELLQVFREARDLQRWFAKNLTPSQQRDISRFVADVKNSAARQRRAEQLAERLMLTMDAERDLPPIIKIALARNYKAAEGWKLMTARQQRGHLLGIFYYRTPEGQQRRLAKAMEEMVARFEKNAAESKA